MSRALLRWIVTTLAVLAIPYLVSGVHVANFGAALAFAFVLGVLNTLIRPILVVLTLPFTFLSLGLFLLVINALIFEWAGGIVGGVTVEGFGAAFVAALLVSIITWVMDFATGKKNVHIRRVDMRSPQTQRPTRADGTIDLHQEGNKWE